MTVALTPFENCHALTSTQMFVLCMHTEKEDKFGGENKKLPRKPTLLCGLQCFVLYEAPLGPQKLFSLSDNFMCVVNCMFCCFFGILYLFIDISW